MKTYELALILTPSLSEEEARSFVSTLTQQLAGAEASVEKTDLRGVQQLSHPIAHQTQGYRVFVELKSENGAALNEKIRGTLAHEEKVLRHGVVIKPKVAPPREKPISVLSEVRREKHAAARAASHHHAPVQEVATQHAQE